MLPIKVKKLRPDAVLPTYESEFAAGADLHACLDNAVTVEPGQTQFIPTGLSMEIPVGCVGLIYARSGLACKKGLAENLWLPSIITEVFPKRFLPVTGLPSW